MEHLHHSDIIFYKKYQISERELSNSKNFQIRLTLCALYRFEFKSAWIKWKKQLTCIESPGYLSGFQDNRFSELANCTNCCCWNFSVGSISTRATAWGQGHVANRWKKLCMTLVASNPPKDEKLFSYWDKELLNFHN